MSYTNGLDKPSDYFNTKLYAGNSSTQSITGVGFQPDWTWIKYRNDGTYGHDLYDAVRGATKTLNTNNTLAEYTSADRLTSFDSDGFSLGSNASVNNSGGNYVSWNWLASNTTASNTDGSITSTVSANTTAGFSIVTYSGNGTAGATVGHGLGSVLSMIIVKQRNNTRNWVVSGLNIGFTKYLYLDSTQASNTADFFNDTNPTSSVFSLSSDSGTNNSSGNYVAYCFAEKKGFSSFGSYVGNGSTDGTFVYTGFKPAFIMVKRTDATQNWVIYDNTRDSFNVADARLRANLSNAEDTQTGGDFLSNGFKLRDTNDDKNISGGSYIYMAFAESPFTTSTGIPTTAR